MDERIRQGYCKVHSELFTMILLLAAGSVVVNVAFFHKNMGQLWLEYVILVGSPVYRLVRLRMLEIAEEPKAGGKKGLGIRLISGILGAISVFMLVEYVRIGKIEWRAVFVFLIPFVLMFCMTVFLVKKLQGGWKRKLNGKYGD